MKTKWLAYIIITLFISIMPATATITINDSTTVFNNTGHNITFSTNQTFDTIRLPADNLELLFNITELHINSSSDLILSNLTYNSDILNLTANGTGTLNITAKFLNNNHLYYFYINNTSPPEYTTTSNATGWVTYSYDLTSQHDITIQPDTTTPTLTANSLSTTSAQQVTPITLTASFTDNINVTGTIAKIEQPDGTQTNYTMSCTTGTTATCSYTYTNTGVIGTYYIRSYYPSDDTGNTANITSSLSFTITLSPAGQSPGGGSPTTPSSYPTTSTTSTPTPTPTPTPPPPEEPTESAGCTPDSYLYNSSCSILNSTSLRGITEIKDPSTLKTFITGFITENKATLKGKITEYRTRDWKTYIRDGQATDDAKDFMRTDFPQYIGIFLGISVAILLTRKKDVTITGLSVYTIIILLVMSTASMAGLNTAFMNFIIGSTKNALTVMSYLIWAVGITWGVNVYEQYLNNKKRTVRIRAVY